MLVVTFSVAPCVVVWSRGQADVLELVRDTVEGLGRMGELLYDSHVAVTQTYSEFQELLA